MKVNEAPEKIYLHPDIGDKEFIRPWLKRPLNENSVEYVRTDAFIEKARKWFEMQNEEVDPNGTYQCDMTDFEDFRSYMKDEDK